MPSCFGVIIIINGFVEASPKGAAGVGDGSDLNRYYRGVTYTFVTACSGMMVIWPLKIYDWASKNQSTQMDGVDLMRSTMWLLREARGGPCLLEGKQEGFSISTAVKHGRNMGLFSRVMGCSGVKIRYGTLMSKLLLLLGFFSPLGRNLLSDVIY